MLVRVYDFLCSIWQYTARENDRHFRGNCDFSGWSSQEEAGFTEAQGNKYQPASDRLVNVLRHFPINAQDRILDIGCGKGKAMYLMSRLPFGVIRGYDISDSLVEIANENFHALDLEQCEAVVGDALDFNEYDQFNYFFMFNPFPQKIFGVVMKNLMESLKRYPRKCVLIYLNPVYHEYIVAQTPFHLVYKKKSLLHWYDFFCYQYEGENSNYYYLGKDLQNA
ncbi:MAG: class I SAM-dependent methyltransferase [Clostridiales bacterium]|nr:class I SAM-dependent methyltransferase [Clostridiales bacterium]